VRRNFGSKRLGARHKVGHGRGLRAGKCSFSLLEPLIPGKNALQRRRLNLRLERRGIRPGDRDHAIGSVSNNGASYVAAGGFNGSYNFGSHAAAFTISNFDGNTFTAAGTVPLSGASYSLAGSAPRTGMTGNINGTFYGPMAAETGGNFTLQSAIGVPYMASGIFAGKR
jgi:hypothetical protein